MSVGYPRRGLFIAPRNVADETSGHDSTCLLETLHTALFVDLCMLFLAPDISELRCLSGGLKHFCSFAVDAVPDLLPAQWNMAGHLPVSGHLYLALTAPDCPLRRPLPAGLYVVPIFTFTANIFHSQSRLARRSMTFWTSDHVSHLSLGLRRR